MNVFSAAMTLFLVMNPLGNIPIFISSLQHLDPSRRMRIIFREAIFALIILVFFMFGGKYIIDALKVSAPALSIAGGVVLFLIAIRLIFPQPKTNHDKQTGEPFLVPLAIPLFAGPASMATAMLLANQYPGHVFGLLMALVISWAVSSSLLLLSSKLSEWLGEKGLVALERLMGILLTTIAVQMFLTGIQQFFQIT
jgi:MarC family membrane protein